MKMYCMFLACALTLTPAAYAGSETAEMFEDDAVSSAQRLYKDVMGEEFTCAYRRNEMSVRDDIACKGHDGKIRTWRATRVEDEAYYQRGKVACSGVGTMVLVPNNETAVEDLKKVRKKGYTEVSTSLTFPEWKPR